MASWQFHFTLFRRDGAYDAIWSDLSILDLTLLQAKIAMSFSVTLRHGCAESCKDVDGFGNANGCVSID